MTAEGAGPTIRVAIVDDETLARDGIRLRLEREPDVEVVGEFSSTDAALEQLPELTVDVIQAFGVRARDYLVKPYDDERFVEMLDRVRSASRSSVTEHSAARYGPRCHGSLAPPLKIRDASRACP